MTLLLDQTWNGSVQRPVEFLRTINSGNELGKGAFWVEFLSRDGNTLKISHTHLNVRLWPKPVTLEDSSSHQLRIHSNVELFRPGDEESGLSDKDAHGQFLFITHDCIEEYFQRKIPLNVYQRLAHKPKSGDVLRYLMQAIQEHSTYFAEPSIGFFSCIVNAVCEELLKEHLVDSWELPRINAPAWRKLYDVLETMDGDRLTIDEMATVMKLSPRHFSRLFSKCHGMSPYQYAIRWRLNKSIELMLENDRPLVEIALEVGFSDQSGYIRAFRKYFGKCPLAMRQELVGLRAI